MKRCPKCSRTFPDDNQKFCTFDGGRLVFADKPFDPNATIQTVTPDQYSSIEGAHTEPDFGETIATSSSAPTVVFPKDTGPTGSKTEANLHQRPPTTSPSSATAPTQVFASPSREAAKPKQTVPAPAPPVPVAPATIAPARQKSKLPLVLGILAVLILLGIGGAVAAFFLVVKPRLERLNAEQPIVRETQPANENTNISSNSNANIAETKPAESEFVPPPDTTRFTNSPANLDGKLAEHYLDFSFYYPNNWIPDPKAGVAGSGNFAKVERRLPPDFTQENFAVRWYESKGSYAEDLPNFPSQVEEFSASLAKAFPGYRKVSEGPTKINSLDAYEFKWVGLSKGTEKGDLQLWGRVVFVPTGVAGDNNGAILTMFTTSLAPELASVEDVGTKGEMPVILDSFRFGRR